MAIIPTEFGGDAEPQIFETSLDPSTTEPWAPMLQHECSFGPNSFVDAMMNLIRNPNINSSWLFRADILLARNNTEDEDATATATARDLTGPEGDAKGKTEPRIVDFTGFMREKTLIRKLIPRNEKRDKPLDQTCLIYRSFASKNDQSLEGEGQGKQQAQEQDKNELQQKSLVVYIPHLSSASEVPFYHPSVRGIGFLHTWNPTAKSGSISIHYKFFPEDDKQGQERPKKLCRTALALITVLHKHGTGNEGGYVKRVHHDALVAQARLQNRYAELKMKHAARLVRGWAEVTDPEKHVFEDLGIAAFLIELWDDMYAKEKRPFPGFVDIGCGNGLLVHILNLEGYQGWGFDARVRKSWEVYRKGEPGHESLQQRVLLPSLVSRPEPAPQGAEATVDYDDDDTFVLDEEKIHDGKFPQGTFIVSNHADELTPWTPILAAQSNCPFMMIPCCSHNLAGSRQRAPAPKNKNKSMSAYSSLVCWVAEIAEDCGWEPETEMLRIPSTRNTAIIGRRLLVQNTRNTAVVGRERVFEDVDLGDIVGKYGGTEGYYENVRKLSVVSPRGH
ncbi:tRNA(Ser) Um(44) 2'-O-methyltransferase [Zalerion maritima]|uniref:tRNA (uracil-O(2)-)-methyltransferase n=1 Tax=Zalerion maritima TaxID=339359 RepID=A0AAD5RV14_9PEZI|nr:tRNA(Ser) Um(44) 2'-O-methyltransferase [Zalerion maritima]